MADPPESRPLLVLRGLLAIALVRRGTGSEQQALVLETDAATSFTLVKLGGPSFGLPAEAALAGRQVEVSGYLIGSELRFTRIDPI